MLEILKASKQFPNQRLPPFIPEFQGKVTISIAPNKGRCLLAQETFHPGELIICHRALEIIFPEPHPLSQPHQSSTTSSLLAKVKRFRLLKESLARLAGNDEDFRKKLYFLSAGPKLGFIDDKSTEDYPDLKENCVNYKRIEGIILVNGMEGCGGGSFGLWFLPSFINHDCWKVNAGWAVVNDVILVRAQKRIQNGEEILISYTDPDQPYFVRRELFLKHNFLCVCKLCMLEKAEGTGIREKRDQILTSFQDLISNPNSNVNLKQGIISILEELRGLRSSWQENPFILQPLMNLGLALYEEEDYSGALSVFKEGFRLCEAFPQFSAVATTLSCAVIRCYLKLLEGEKQKTDNYKEEIKEWIRNLKGCMRIQYGVCIEEDGEWLEILSITNPSFYVQIEKYFNK